MTQFEELLLKTGNPDLICAFIREHRENLSKDFAQNFEFYCEQTKRKLADVCFDTDIQDMKIKEFLDIYGWDMSPSTKSRVCNWLPYANIKTVRDLLQYSYIELARIYGLGSRSVILLEKAIEKAGYQLRD